MHLELESNIKYYVLWYVWLKFHAGEFALYKSSARTSSGRNTCKMTQRKITTYRNVSDLTAQTKIACTSTTIESKSDTLIFYLFIIFLVLSSYSTWKDHFFSAPFIHIAELCFLFKHNLRDVDAHVVTLSAILKYPFILRAVVEFHTHAAHISRRWD